MANARVILAVLLSLLTISLTGCFSSQPEDVAVFLKPHEVDASAKMYALRPPDIIEIHCSPVPEIHQHRQQIRPDGKVSFEILGEVEAAGKTPEMLAENIKEKVAALYTLDSDKAINVRVNVFRSKTYYVLGQVYLPGAKEYTGYDTLLSAIAEARPNPSAWVKRIQVVRPSSDPDVKAKIFEVNLERMVVHGECSKNVLLQEGDIVYVPPTVLGSAGLFVEELLRPIGRAFSTVNIAQRVGAGYPSY